LSGHSMQEHPAPSIVLVRRETCSSAAEFEALVQRNLAANAGLNYAGLARLTATMAARELRGLLDLLPAARRIRSAVHCPAAEGPPRSADAALGAFKLRRAAWVLEALLDDGGWGALAAPCPGSDPNQCGTRTHPSTTSTSGSAADCCSKVGASLNAAGAFVGLGGSECGSADVGTGSLVERRHALADAIERLPGDSGGWVGPEAVLRCTDDGAVAQVSQRLVQQIWALLALLLP